VVFFHFFVRLDIEHTDGKRYFTWDSTLFAEPVRMQHTIAQHGRKLVRWGDVRA
jgi:alpha-glucosidase (family GH31 glycosyl hydrolase)